MPTKDFEKYLRKWKDQVFKTVKINFRKWLMIFEIIVRKLSFQNYSLYGTFLKLLYVN